jgi:hypothetical protein
MLGMAYALETRMEERPAPAEGFALSGLWMLPILLLALIFDKFRRHLAKLKDMRRTRPMPKDWRSFYPDLRRSEWAIHWFCFEGARQIILGQDLDLSALSLDPEPPDSFQPSMPRSAIAMHRRLEDIARFHADPERWIRRHAERIRERNSECDRDSGRISNPSNFLSTSNWSNPDPSNFRIPDVRIAIRGPPRLVPTADCPLPRAPHARERGLMPEPAETDRNVHQLLHPPIAAFRKRAYPPGA